MNRYRNLYKRILLEYLLFEGSHNNRDAIFLNS